MIPKQQGRASAAGESVGFLIRAAAESEKQGRIADAFGYLRRALAAAPHDSRVLAQFGSLLVRDGRHTEAVKLLAEAARRAPAAPHVHHALGLAYLAAGDVRNADRQLRKAVKLAPQAVPPLRSLGDCRVAAQKPEEAEPFYQKALALAPLDHETRIRLAGLYAYLGRKEEARSLYGALAAEGVQNPLVLAGLIEVSDYSPGEDEPAEYQAAISMANDRAIPLPLRRMLHFSAARIDRARRRREAEFERYQQAKSLFTERFDLAYFAAVTRSLKQATTPEFFAARARYADKSTRPVFVFGMPRSGTTLTEQILSAHPSAAAAGELTFFPDAARNMGIASRRLDQSIAPDKIAAALEALQPSDAKKLAAQYLEQLQLYGVGKNRVTDKMPQNFLHLWLIALLFPHGTFIHCVRDPVATCFSCYTTDLGDGHNYTADFETLSGYFRIYQDLMQHWVSVLPVTIFESRYEDLVQNPEPSIRALLAAARLPWSESCLSFHESGRTALTASYSEVRKPLHAENVEKWRAYEKFLAPLQAALKNTGSAPQSPFAEHQKS
jgi:Flp pilus assembly protein TadD